MDDWEGMISKFPSGNSTGREVNGRDIVLALLRELLPILPRIGCTCTRRKEGRRRGAALASQGGYPLRATPEEPFFLGNYIMTLNSRMRF